MQHFTAALQNMQPPSAVERGVVRVSQLPSVGHEMVTGVLVLPSDLVPWMGTRGREIGRDRQTDGQGQRQDKREKVIERAREGDEKRNREMEREREREREGETRKTNS